MKIMIINNNNNDNNNEMIIIMIITIIISTRYDIHREIATRWTQDTTSDLESWKAGCFHCEMSTTIGTNISLMSND
jgi:hypothetical protein